MPTCFVIMGFGVRPDFATNRSLDLDVTYRVLIKPAAKEAGLECVRADEIGHGTLDVAMYEQLLEAEVVIADISTSNANALYELGIRHALRPRSTVIIAEQESSKGGGLPFDLSHVAVLFYKHFGEDIGSIEKERFVPLLADACRAALRSENADSPVYTFLHSLQPPTRPRRSADTSGSSSSPSEPIAPLLTAAQECKNRGDYAQARRLLKQIDGLRNNDPYVIQQLAYVTYMDRSATTPMAGLQAAHDLLLRLRPESTNDPQTISLWGAVHKRFWEMTKDEDARARHLDAALRAYERGFVMAHDHYSGINLAYLLHLRSAHASPADAVADFVRCQRIRKEVIAACEALLQQTDLPANEQTWIHASLAEAWLGLDERTRSAAELKCALTSLSNEHDRINLRDKLEQIGRLLSDSPFRLLSADAPR